MIAVAENGGGQKGAAEGGEIAVADNGGGHKGAADCGVIGFET